MLHTCVKCIKFVLQLHKGWLMCNMCHATIKKKKDSKFGEDAKSPCTLLEGM